MTMMSKSVCCELFVLFGFSGEFSDMCHAVSICLLMCVVRWVTDVEPSSYYKRIMKANDIVFLSKALICQ